MVGQFGKDHGILVRFRGSQYAAVRSAAEHPLAFISHDSRVKEEVARPLAIALSKLMCPVWYDEFSLKVGESLRESIEKGIKECKKCVLILSPQFFANRGWTKVEFNSIFTREILQQQQYILPVWHGVSKEEVFEYCPSLVDKLAAIWSGNAEAVARKLLPVIK